MINTANNALNIASIFCSIQGESTTQGELTSFIRLAGCNLNCTWCDTRWSHSEGTIMSLPEIIDSVSKHGSRYVTVTGGEPLLQKSCMQLLKALLENNFEISLETNGTIDISGIDQGIRIIMDIKCPGSTMDKHNNLENIEFLKTRDKLKFVLPSKAYY